MSLIDEINEKKNEKKEEKLFENISEKNIEKNNENNKIFVKSDGTKIEIDEFTTPDEFYTNEELCKFAQKQSDYEGAEAKEMMKEELEREASGFYQIEYEKNFSKIITPISKKDELKLKKDSIEAKKCSIKFDFIRHFTKFSYKNEDAIEILFHSFLSTMTKDIQFKLNNKKILQKLHFMWLQNSGSGKGECFKEYGKILNAYNKVTDKPLVVYWADGSETMQSYYNGYFHDGKKYHFDKPTIGIFELADVILIEECSYIFVEKRGSGQTRSEIMLKALEDQSMSKRLASWGENETTTIPNFVLLASSRFVPETQETIISSGFLQRLIPYFRNVNSEIRTEMCNRVISYMFTSTNIEEDSIKTRIDLSKRFVNMRKWIKTHNEFTFKNEQKCINILSNKIKELNTKLINSVVVLEHKLILESFISRFTNKIMIIAIHNAILRQSTNINETDMQIAVDLFDNINAQLTLWVEQTINEKRFLKNRRYLFKKWLSNWFKIKPSYTLKELAILIEKQTMYSSNYSYDLIKSNSEGAKAPLKKLDNREYVMNKTL